MALQFREKGSGCMSFKMDLVWSERHVDRARTVDDLKKEEYCWHFESYTASRTNELKHEIFHSVIFFNSNFAYASCSVICKSVFANTQRKMDTQQMKIKSLLPFAHSMFQKKCTRTQHSGDQPFVMSQRALIALSGKQESAQADFH